MFQGFTPETIDFLWGIRMNNNRDWFTANKSKYVEALYNPMKDLGQDLFAPFRERSGDILKVSRIYRDARLHHPDPYKESLWICIRRDVDWWAENPCLFFEIRPEGVSYGFSLWRPKVAAMENFRQRIAAKPEEFLALAEKVRSDTGLELTAQCYKKPKEAPIPALQPYYGWRMDIGCIREEPVSEALFGPALGQRAGEFLERLIPVYDYFNTVTAG